MPFKGKHKINENRSCCQTIIKSHLTPSAETKGIVVELNEIELTDIPSAMRNMGWEIAPFFMERWFSGDAFVISDDVRKKYDNHPTTIPKEHLDEKTVTMKWLMNFQRVKKAYDHLVKNWKSENSLNGLINKSKKAIKNQNGKLGSKDFNARELHEHCQIQFRKFGGLYESDIDDLYGSIGNANLYLAAIGEVIQNGQKVKITDFGIYLRDIYEFNGDDPLGLWTKDGVFDKIETPFMYIHKSALDDTVRKNFGPMFRLCSKFVEDNSQVAIESPRLVYDAHFREYRKETGKGGDFYIFSDVMWEKPKGEELIISLE